MYYHGRKYTVLPGEYTVHSDPVGGEDSPKDNSYIDRG